MLQKTIILSAFLALLADQASVAKAPKTSNTSPNGSASTSHSSESTSPTTTNTGLQYTDLKLGNGQTPQEGDIVVVQYTGTLPDGKKFDSFYRFHLNC